MIQRIATRKTLSITLNLISLFLSSLYCFAATPLQKDFVFRHLTRNDGLPSNDVKCITQDTDGFIWIGTIDGFVRYDGYSFASIESLTTDITILSSNYINCIVEDNNRRLWIGTNEGLYCFNLKTYRFEYLESIEADSVATAVILSLYVDRKHCLWIGTDSVGLYKYDLETQDIIKESAQFTIQSLQEAEINCICEDKLDRLWFATNFGLGCYDAARGVLSSFLGEYNIKSFFIDSKGVLWAGTQSDGVWYSSDLENPVFLVVTSLPDLSQYLLGYVYGDSDGRIWIAVRDSGIFLSNSDHSVWINLRSQRYHQQGLSSNVPQRILEDRDGNIWITTFDSGISLLEKNRKRFYHIKDNYSPDGLQNNRIRFVYQDSDGDIWIGTKIGGMLSRFDSDDFSFVHYKHDPNNPFSLSDDYVFCITEERPGYLWVGTYNGGLNLFNKKTGKSIVYRHDPNNTNSISQDSIYTLLKAHDGRLWIGTMYRGLDVYDRRNNLFSHYHHTSDPESISSNEIRGYLFEDYQNNIWVGTRNGLNLYNESSDSFTRFNQENSALSDNFINCIYEDRKGNLWVATNGGLSLMDRTHGSFISYTKQDGLPTNVVLGILEDDSGNLWISTANGLSKFDVEGSVFSSYYLEDGLQGNEFERYCFCRLHSGEMIFGGSNGFNLFHPEEIVDNPVVPSIAFVDFRIFNKSVSPDERNSVLSSHINSTEEITLNHLQSVFTVEFTAINYTVTDNNQYAFKVDGFEKEWNYVGTQRNATYTNLDHGRYTFKVKASNNDGVWNEKGRALTITVLPPWWKTWVFRMSSIFAVIVISSIIYIYRIKSLKEHRIQLEKLVKDRTQEIEEKNKDLCTTNILLKEKQQQIKAQTKELNKNNQRLKLLNATKDRLLSVIAHDLKNPFNAIMGFSEILITRYNQLTKEKKQHYLRIINESAKAANCMLENLLNWAGSQAGTIQFNPEIFDLNELINTNLKLVGTALVEKEIEVHKVLPKKSKTHADKNMINSVIRNLLANAIKFTDNGSINIEVTPNENFWVFSIKDTGIGIPKNKIMRLFDIGSTKSTAGTRGESGSGLGLILCKDFIEKNGGIISAKANEDNGATFSFTLPRAESSPRMLDRTKEENAGSYPRVS